MSGYQVIRDAIPETLREAALRRLNLHIAEHGLTPRDILDGYNGSALPAMQMAPELVALRDLVLPFMGWEPGDAWDYPQIIMRYPDKGLTEPELHIDVPPFTYAITDAQTSPPSTRATNEGLVYRMTAGVPLAGDTVLRAADGCHRASPGDVLLMTPDTLHARSLHREGAVRWAVYFRVFKPAP